MAELSHGVRTRLTRFAEALVDQSKARVLISPQESREGFWFGAGNVIRAPDGAFYLVGRYRNQGDSRAGLDKGERGVELAVFRSTDGLRSLTKVLSFSKAELNVGDRAVVSIEGAKLHLDRSGIELFVSTEKSGIGYPEHLQSFQKPGTGVWTIDSLRADSVEGLKAAPPSTLLESADPRWLHLKDPVVFDSARGDTLLYFCTHPYNWSSANSALAVRGRDQGRFSEPDYQFFPRGFAWDVAISRITGLCRLPVTEEAAAKKTGIPRGSVLVFYDGGESLRNYEEHPAAVKRPRGYSCEELGGIALMVEPAYDRIERLSIELPAFVSPHGTGCSRYVNVFETEVGYYATWQQSQPDRSQPLVANFLSRSEAVRILRG